MSFSLFSVAKRFPLPIDESVIVLTELIPRKLKFVEETSHSMGWKYCKSCVLRVSFRCRSRSMLSLVRPSLDGRCPLSMLGSMDTQRNEIS